MNYSIIFKMLSMVLWVMALAFSACTGVSLLYGASPLESEAMPSWICVIALCVMLAFALYLPSPQRAQKALQKGGDVRRGAWLDYRLRRRKPALRADSGLRVSRRVFRIDKRADNHGLERVF